MQVIVQYFDPDGPLAQFAAAASPEHRVREVRLPEAVFDVIALREDFQHAFDPASRNSDLDAGYCGVLYGIDVSVDLPSEAPRRRNLPNNQYLVFLE